MYDVIIVGGSFAGLAVAMQLQGQRVLVVDQYPIGSHQSSTCGTPIGIAEMVGASEATMERHDALVMHAAGRRVRFRLPEPFVTFDYEKFCLAMLAGSDAEVLVARATDIDAGRVVTTKGTVEGRFVVVATGWRAYRGREPNLSGSLERAGHGIETELPVRVDVEPGLHFHFERRIVDHGYAWVFPCGKSTRIGLISSRENMGMRRRLDEFVGSFGLEVGATHGGVVPVVRRQPLAGDLFLVGDAAGQCLPITDEGIRAAILHGTACGKLIGQALRGEIPVAEARRRYSDVVRRTDRFHTHLLHFMTVVDRTPEQLIAAFGRLSASTGFADFALRRYLAGSGWAPPS